MVDVVEKLKIAVVYEDEQGKRKGEYIYSDNDVQSALGALGSYIENCKYRFVDFSYEEIEVEEEWDPSAPAYQINNSSTNNNEDTEL